MNKEEVIALQRTLNDSGFGPLVVDGIYGENTSNAYSRMLRLSDAAGRGTVIPVPNPVKPWWTSRALIGSIVTVVASVTGVSLGVGGSESLTESIVAILTAISGLIAFYGTLKRDAPIDKTTVLPGVRVPGKSPFLDQ